MILAKSVVQTDTVHLVFPEVSQPRQLEHQHSLALSILERTLPQGRLVLSLAVYRASAAHQLLVLLVLVLWLLHQQVWLLCPQVWRVWHQVCPGQQAQLWQLLRVVLRELQLLLLSRQVMERLLKLHGSCR